MEIDRKTLKALAADTRLDILKSLSARRKMPSELSKELNLAASTVTEHLDRLEEAGLIRREETGHKWIYYELTPKGESLVKPKVPIQFVFVLGVCMLVIAAGFLYISYQGNYSMTSVPSVSKNVPAPNGLATQTSAEQTIATNITNSTNSTNSTSP